MVLSFLLGGNVMQFHNVIIKEIERAGVGLLLLWACLLTGSSALGAVPKAAGPVTVKQSAQKISLTNQHLSIQIARGDSGFYLTGIFDTAAGQNFLPADSTKLAGKLWELTLRRDKGRETK